MGASGSWIQALIGQKKPDKEENEKVVVVKSRKWKLWRSPISSSTGKDFRRNYGLASPREDDASTVAVAKVVRAPHKDFRVVRQEWAAIWIQTAFRGFLARRALKALRGVVRLQALVRGRQVRKKAAEALRSMQALAHIQAQVMAHHVEVLKEEQVVQQMLKENHGKIDHLKQAEEQWCDSKGTLEDVKVKMQMKQEGACKSHRAIAYSVTQKVQIEKNMVSAVIKHLENSKHDPVTIRKNNVKFKVSPKPALVGELTPSSSSSKQHDGSASSSSCASTGPVSVKSDTVIGSDKTPDGGNGGNVQPNYMNLTESTRARQKTNYLLNRRFQRLSMDEYQLLTGLHEFSCKDIKSSIGSDVSVDIITSPVFPNRWGNNYLELR